MSIVEQILAAPPHQTVGFDAFCKGQAELTTLHVVMALQQVRTRRGAERIYRAELNGLRRATVLTAATRRLDDFDRVVIAKGSATSNATTLHNLYST